MHKITSVSKDAVNLLPPSSVATKLSHERFQILAILQHVGRF